MGRKKDEGVFNIVDYAHDDLASSPHLQDGEFLGKQFGSNVQTITPNKLDSPQFSNHQHDASQPHHDATKQSEHEVGEGVNAGSDLLHKFLPPPLEDMCPGELQEKIKNFIWYKSQGKSFNVEVRNRKNYRNPDFLRHAVRYQDIDEIGSCFSKDVFDPHGYDESDYYDAIEADMKREMERKEQERKKSLKVDFVSGGTQAGNGATAQKVTLPSPGISNLPSAGLQSSSADMLTRDIRINKKSKWDKVEGDRRNVLIGGQDTLSSVGAHAALLSAANAGSGYAAFAQQRRREAEEKRSSDRKVERRS